MAYENRPPILFLNLGWMKKYDGASADDPTRGNFGYLNEGRTHGHECFNFANQHGFCYGHHPGSSNTDLRKLGGDSTASSVDGVLVIWFSRDPRTNKAVIVGWYRNATVFREFQDPPSSNRRMPDGSPVTYKTKAKHEDCQLIREPLRQYPIPSRHEKAGGYGQNANWYGLGESFLNKIWTYTLDWRGSNLKSKLRLQPPQNPDPLLRAKIEQAAIRCATHYYQSAEGGNRIVTSVEKDNLGWDLEAKSALDTLRIEVKGLSGPNPVAELTPNEYSKMQEHRLSWVLFIVTECLKPSRRFYEFRFMHDAKRWETPAGLVLSIQPKVAALVSIRPT